MVSMILSEGLSASASMAGFIVFFKENNNCVKSSLSVGKNRIEWLRKVLHDHGHHPWQSRPYFSSSSGPCAKVQGLLGHSSGLPVS